MPTFSHPDYTVGSGIPPDLLTPHCDHRSQSDIFGMMSPWGRSRAFTAGRELPSVCGKAHPAPKVVLTYPCVVGYYYTQAMNFLGNFLNIT